MFKFTEKISFFEREYRVSESRGKAVMIFRARCKIESDVWNKFKIVVSDKNKIEKMLIKVRELQSNTDLHFELEKLNNKL